MYISHLSAHGFRNLYVEEIELAQGINILHGNNAQGKTNFLEAIYFCAFVRSLRAGSDKELVCFDATSANIRAKLVRGNSNSYQTIDAYIEKHGARVTKSISINRVPIRHMKDLFGRLLVVMFTPEDLRLIKSGPSERRRFMDMEICQLSNVYYSDLREYHRVLKQRNALLKILQKDKSQVDSLDVWDEQLEKYGVRIIKTRADFIKKLSGISKEIHANITQKSESLEIVYIPNIANPGDYLRELKRSRKRDIIQGSTSFGIHKDDLTFTINGISARNFGSQGQQRTAALSAKLAEIEIIKQSTRETPVLLLDDVFSELDSGRQKFLLSQISDIQTLITCTGIDSILGLGRVLHVENGGVKAL